MPIAAGGVSLMSVSGVWGPLALNRTISHFWGIAGFGTSPGDVKLPNADKCSLKKKKKKNNNNNNNTNSEDINGNNVMHRNEEGACVPRSADARLFLLLQQHNPARKCLAEKPSSSHREKSPVWIDLFSTMPPRKNPPQYDTQHNTRKPNNNNNNNNRNSASRGAQKVERIIANDSLRATDEERHMTSKSLYDDPTARVSSNLQAIHDRIRPRAYQSIFKHIKGKSLLHLGCGMGLISMMAARSSASVVVAVDRSAIVDSAQIAAKQNGLENISFHRGSLRAVMAQFPVKKFDVILCEWMGAFLVNEPLMEEAIFARDNLLAPDGIMCPDGSSLHVVGVSDYPFFLSTVDYWSNVYGFTMNPMKALVRKEVETCVIPSTNIVTTTCLAHTVNIMQLHSTEEGSQGPNDYTVPFTIRATEDTTVNFLTFFVDATFTNPHNPGANFVIGIRPGGTNAWTETSVGFHDPLPVKAGEAITGELRVRVLDMQRGVAALEVTARTEGHVVEKEVKGSYVYQRY